MLFPPIVALFHKKIACNIISMAVLMCMQCLDLRKNALLGQPPR